MSTWYFPVKLPSDEKQPRHQRPVLCLAAIRDLGSFKRRGKEPTKQIREKIG